jgi:hypothetical protein
MVTLRGVAKMFLVSRIKRRYSSRNGDGPVFRKAAMRMIVVSI